MQENPSHKEMAPHIRKLESERSHHRQTRFPQGDADWIYRRILESISDAVIVTDDGGKIRYVCPNTAQVLGLSQAEIDEQENIKGLLGEIRYGGPVPPEQGESLNLECALTPTDGQKRCLQVNIKTIDIYGGCLLYVIHDITVQKRKFEQLEAYKNIINLMQDGVSFLDINYRFVMVNDAYERLADVSKEQFSGLSVADHLGQEVFDVTVKPYFDRCVQGETVNYRQWFDYPNLGRRYMDVTYSPYRNSEGEITGLIATTRDITTEVRAEIKYRELVELAQEGIWVIDETNQTRFANSSMAKMLGYTPEEMADKSLFDFMDEQGRTIANKNIERRKQGIIEQHDFEFITKAGRRIYTTVETAPILDTEGNYQGAIAGIIDITQRREALKALEKSGEKFKALFENSPDIVALTDLSGTFLEINRVIPGYEKSDVIGTKAVEYLSPEDRQAYHQTVEAVVETGRPQSYSARIKTPEGRDTHWHNRIAPLMSSAGVERLVINFTDITAQKRLEDAYLQSEARFKSLVENLPDPVWLKDADGVYLSCNHSFERLFGAKEAEIIGKTDYDFVEKEQADFFRKHDRNAMAAGRPRLNEEELIFAADGYQGLFETIKTPIYDAASHLIGVLGIARDITERETAKREIKNRQTELHNLLHTVQCGIVVCAADTAIVDLNPAASKLLGKPREDLIGVKADADNWNFIAESKKPLPTEKYPVNIVKRTGKPLTDHILGLERPDQRETVWLLVNAAPEFGEDGTLQKIIVSSADISELKKTQSLLEQKRRELVQAHKMESIGSLAGGIAHDFNNILASIIGFTELALEEAAAGSSLADSLEEVFAAGKRAQKLVQQILTFARQSDEKRKPLHVDAIVTEVLRFMRSSLPANIEIRQKVESGAVIIGNPTQVHQMLMNLCTNAAHAMEANGGTLFVGLEENAPADDLGLKPGPYVEIIVADNGEGIPEEILNSIFDPYFTTKSAGKGTGMGLAVVHGIVESYGGKILVDSVVGRGTTVTIYLPMSQRAKLAPIDESELLPRGSECILLVDDEVAIAKMGRQMLTGLGYTVTTRSSGLEALELFKAKPMAFDLVITDMTMPNLTGDILAAELMKIRADIPIILCTGYSNKISEEVALEMGLRDLILKPIVKADLAKIVRRVLDGAPG
jgi:PAS domain S-box-containing protein